MCDAVLFLNTLKRCVEHSVLDIVANTVFEQSV